MGCVCSTPTPRAPIIVNAGLAATEQAGFNVKAGLQQRGLNLINQKTPEGTLKFRGTGGNIAGIPQIEAVTTLSNVQQRLFDTKNRISSRFGNTAESQLKEVQGTLSSPFSTDSFGAAPVANEATRKASLDAILARLQPQRDIERNALETSLAGQGFATGSEGFDNAFDRFNRGQSDLLLAADAQAGNEQARQFGLETNARDRAINEALLERNQPLNELAALISGSAPSKPSFIPTPQGQIAAPDFLGAEFGAANQQNAFNTNLFNRQVETRNNTIDGLFGLAGAAIPGFKFG